MIVALALLVSAASIVAAIVWGVRQVLAQLAAAEAARAAAYQIPGPLDLAVAFGAAAVAGNRYESIEAAMVAAWVAIPAFWNGRDQYLAMAPSLVFGQPPSLSPTEGSASERTITP